MKGVCKKRNFTITILIEKSSFHKQTLDMYLEHFATCHRIKIYNRGAGTSNILVVHWWEQAYMGGLICPCDWNI